METAITDRGVTRRFRRVAEAVPAARAFVRRWLPRSAPAEGLVLAGAEAINNVVDHATGDHVTVAVELDGSTGIVTVTDDGPGFAPPARLSMPDPLASRHRGLAMMDASVDRVEIASSPSGTTVTLTQRFERPRTANAPGSRHGDAGSAVA